MDMKKQLITSALPYVNNVPHLGNLIGSVLSADVFARFCRARRCDTLFVCGTDEYGTTTEVKAEQQGKTCQQLCDQYWKLHHDIYKWFDISFDIFGRTSTPTQTQITQHIYSKLQQRGYTKQVTSQQLFSVAADRYLADRFVQGECPACGSTAAHGDQCDQCGTLLDPVDLLHPVCTITNTRPVLKTTNHVHLDLPALQGLLEDARGRQHLWSDNAVQITNAWLHTGLKSRAITRDLQWGTPVPGLPNKVFYVWFDACIGYVSITAAVTSGWRTWWQNPDGVELTCFMGKDNVPFHTIMFPASLLGSGDRWTLPTSIQATEYLKHEGQKFSKSREVGLTCLQAMQSGIPADVWRYYLLSIRPESSDSNFSWADFRAKNNSDLVNNLGNFVNRVYSFIRRHYQGNTPSRPTCPPPPTIADYESKVHSLLEHLITSLSRRELKRGLQTVLQISTLGNKFFQHCQPFTLIKGPDADVQSCGWILCAAVGMVRVLASALSPFLPSTADKLCSLLNSSPMTLTLESEAEIRLCELVPFSHALNETEGLLFQRLTREVVGQQGKPQQCNASVGNLHYMQYLSNQVFGSDASHTHSGNI